MRQSHQKNYSTALRKLTASAIGSVFKIQIKKLNARLDDIKIFQKIPKGDLGGIKKIHRQNLFLPMHIENREKIENKKKKKEKKA